MAMRKRVGAVGAVERQLLYACGEGNNCRAAGRLGLVKFSQKGKRIDPGGANPIGHSASPPEFDREITT